MILSLYLHKNISETLMCYGKLGDVVNKILELCEENVIDIMDMPKCQPRDGASRYDIDVTNEYYLSLLESFPIKSPRISLRRLLYWFVEQEMPDVLGWEVVNDYVDSNKIKMLKKLGGAETDLFKLTAIANNTEREVLLEILNKIRLLKDIVNNGR